MWALDSLLGAGRHAQQYRANDVRHRETEPLMLIGVQVHAVDATRRRHRPGIEELAVALLRNGGQRRRQPHGLVCGTFELWSDRALGLLNRWWRDDENGGHGHARLDRRRTNSLHERSHALRRMRRRELVHRLEVIGAEHEDDEPAA